jgi:hypothetical protein
MISERVPVCNLALGDEDARRSTGKMLGGLQLILEFGIPVKTGLRESSECVA